MTFLFTFSTAITFFWTLLVMNSTMAVTFMTPKRPESVVTSSTSYFVGQLAEDGAILKYDLQGMLDTSFTAPELPNIRGLAINEAGTRVWAAHDGGVAEMALNQDQSKLTLEFTYDTSNVMAEPNALCLTPDETSLFVTGGVTPGMIQLDLATQTFEVKIDETGFIYQGCSVSPSQDVVWLLHRNALGIVQYTIAQETVGEPEAFSEPIANATTNPQVVGDGLVLWENKLYVSTWQVAPPFGGDVWECDLDSMQNICQVWAPGVTAADIQADAQTPDQPQLLLPNLVTQQVSTMPLDAPNKNMTTAPTGIMTESPTKSPEVETDAPSTTPPMTSSSNVAISWPWCGTIRVLSILACCI